MAAYFTSQEIGKEKPFHRGDPLSYNPSYVTEVQLDGDELDEVLNNLHGIPWPSSNLKKRVVTWYGDDARFIYSTLYYKPS